MNFKKRKKKSKLSEYEQEDEEVVPEPNLMGRPNYNIPQQQIGMSASDLLQDVSTQEEAMAKIGVLLADETRSKLMSELPDEEQIKNVAVLIALAKKYKIQFINDVVDNYLVLQISNKRKGRKEIVEVIAGHAQRTAENWKNKIQRLIPLGQN